MSNFNDYFEDQSEAEQIIDDATDKLIGLISEKTKSEIERYKNWYESSDKMRAELQKQVYEQQEKIRVLKVDLKRAKEELVQYPYSKSGRPTVYLDDYQIAGPRAFGVGKTVESYELKRENLEDIQRIVTRELNRLNGIK